MNLLVIFTVLSIVNVIIQTTKSIVTIKCGKSAAALVNAVAYGLYTVVIVYTNADFPLWEKVIVTALVNLVGVYIVKLIEEKTRRDKLWKVEMTVPKTRAETMTNNLTMYAIPFNMVETTSRWTIFNVYCATQKESKLVKEIADKNKAKFFVSETKSLI